MDSWHTTFLGLRHLPREVTAFGIEVFFQISAAESRIIEQRRRPELKLGLALQIGLLRMSGPLLEAVRIVPPLLWRHLGARIGCCPGLGIAARDVPPRAHFARASAGRLRHTRVSLCRTCFSTLSAPSPGCRQRAAKLSCQHIEQR